MANYCEYIMRVVSDDQKSIEELFNRLNESDESKKSIGARIFEAEYLNLYGGEEFSQNSSGKYFVDISGYCAWSVYSCMFDGEHTYYNDLKNREDYNGNTILQVAKELGLDIEIYSEETGIGFAEHYLIEHGELKIDDEKKYYLFESEDYPNIDKILSDYPNVSKDDDIYTDDNGNIVVGGYGEWEFKI